jgi:two-component sensor histidine kinase
VLHAEEQLMHDLRNAASVIRGAASQLHEDAAQLPPDVVANLAEMIARRSDVLVRLLEDLVVVQQVDRGDLQVCLQPVNLADVGDYALADMCQTDKATISVDIPAGLSVLGDPVRLTQVLDNLVTNAVRYGGPHITVRATRDGELVHLEVHDDGPGIPDELAERIFDAYTRGPDSARVGGSGLGLAIVRELCAAMGGTVAYDGSAGTRFRITLPAVVRSERAESLSARAARHAVFWRDADSLVLRVADYAREGLLAGEAVVVVALPEHLTAVHERLRESGVEVERVLASGQLLPVDAGQLRLSVAREGAVRPELFESVVGETLALVRSRWREVRVFSEVATPAWPEVCALALERCWDTMSERESFALLSGYAIQVTDPTFDRADPDAFDPFTDTAAAS